MCRRERPAQLGSTAPLPDRATRKEAVRLFSCGFGPAAGTVPLRGPLRRTKAHPCVRKAGPCRWPQVDRLGRLAGL